MRIISVWARLLIVIIIAFSFSSVPVQAETVGGITFPDQIIKNGKVLQLVGMGERKWLFSQIYVAALYMQTPLDNEIDIIETEQAKCVMVQFDSSILTHTGFKYTFNKGLRKNLPDDERIALKPKFKRFYEYVCKNKFHRGDLISLLYEKDEGIRVEYNHQIMGQIPGVEFMQALYRVWIGKYPDNEYLKNKLLGR